ncbi:hypothetical protein CIK61_14355 [Brevibacterium aurantiacum]|nr:hypothetical protein CIK63_05420 [Brevibacterium aurantiacum]RCS93622.1 hypothetical protein CIK61_14355 [Brevibacterium aurantiacum]
MLTVNLLLTSVRLTTAIRTGRITECAPGRPTARLSMIVARLLHRKATRALPTVRGSPEMSTVCETLVLLKTTPA